MHTECKLRSEILQRWGNLLLRECMRWNSNQHMIAFSHVDSRDHAVRQKQQWPLLLLVLSPVTHEKMVECYAHDWAISFFFPNECCSMGAQEWFCESGSWNCHPTILESLSLWTTRQRRAIILTVMIKSDDKDEVRLLVPKERKVDYVQNVRNPHPVTETLQQWRLGSPHQRNTNFHHSCWAWRQGKMGTRQQLQRPPANIWPAADRHEDWSKF